MKIKKLSLTGMRAFTHAEFEFLPGMNLLVGVNGVGKTTVLDALRICLSKTLTNISSSPDKIQSFTNNDIAFGKKSLQVSCDFEFESEPINLLVIKNRHPNIEDNPLESDGKFKNIEKSVLTTVGLLTELKTVNTLGLFFSTKRSLVVDKIVPINATTGGIAAAYSESLSTTRKFNLRSLAQWFHVQETLAKERPIGLKHIAVLREAVEQFLPGFKNLRVEKIDEQTIFMVDKNGISLSLYQLSDGERGVLSMVLDLARRLSQANPEFENPLKDGIAIVLIDELDLHLHPKWQRTIVENLTRTFPNCQFIATTHSPQIIPSVEPERIQLIKDEEIIHPDRTLGMDSNWILRFLMEADDRPQGSIDAIKKVEDLIDEADFDKARQLMGKFKHVGLDLPEWIMFEARIARLELIDDQE